jgi:hypothetical protein
VHHAKKEPTTDSGTFGLLLTRNAKTKKTKELEFLPTLDQKE